MGREADARGDPGEPIDHTRLLSTPPPGHTVCPNEFRIKNEGTRDNDDKIIVTTNEWLVVKILFPPFKKPKPLSAHPVSDDMID